MALLLFAFAFFGGTTVNAVPSGKKGAVIVLQYPQVPFSSAPQVAGVHITFYFKPQWDCPAVGYEPLLYVMFLLIL